MNTAREVNGLKLPLIIQSFLVFVVRTIKFMHSYGRNHKLCEVVPRNTCSIFNKSNKLGGTKLIGVLRAATFLHG